MKFAIVNGVRVEASKGGRAICPICNSQMIAKCGESKVDHWAHKGSRECDPWWENETAWHRSWKNIFPLEWQETVHFSDSGEKHIADVKTNYGWIIEFQHSYLKPDERRSRNAYYHKLIWIVDGTRRKNDAKQFQQTLSEGVPAVRNKPIARIRIDGNRLLQEWKGTLLVFFHFGGPHLWWRIEQDSEGTAIVGRFPPENFLKIHLDADQKKIDEFNQFVNELSRVKRN